MGTGEEQSKWCKGSHRLPPVDFSLASLWATPVPQFCCWAWCSMAWNILACWSQLSWPCALPASCPSQTTCCGGRVRNRQPWFCVSTIWQQLKHRCVINTVLVTNLNHSIVQPALERAELHPSQTQHMGHIAGDLTWSPNACESDNAACIEDLSTAWNESWFNSEALLNTTCVQTIRRPFTKYYRFKIADRRENWDNRCDNTGHC